MKKVNILNIPKIKEHIGLKHKMFLQTVGQIPIKISADRQLALTRLSAKLSQILQCFKEEKIIDDYHECSIPESDQSYRGFHVSKRGFEKTVYIWTDGTDIILKDSSFLIRSGFLTPFYMTMRDIDVDQYDWDSFSESLLNYIHMVIYERQLSYEHAFWKDSDLLENRKIENDNNE